MSALAKSPTEGQILILWALVLVFLFTPGTAKSVDQTWSLDLPPHVENVLTSVVARIDFKKASIQDVVRFFDSEIRTASAGQLSFRQVTPASLDFGLLTYEASYAPLRPILYHIAGVLHLKVAYREGVLAFMWFKTTPEMQSVRICGRCVDSFRSPVRNVAMAATYREQFWEESGLSRISWHMIWVGDEYSVTVTVPGYDVYLVDERERNVLVRRNVEHQSVLVSCEAIGYKPFWQELQIGGTNVTYNLDIRFEPASNEKQH